MSRVEAERNTVEENDQESSSWIPEISDEKLTELKARIKPVIRCARGVKSLFQTKQNAAYYIEDVNPREVAYTWDPKPTTKAKGLVPLADITTYHTYGYYGLFKPSVAEVLAQIPEAQVDTVVAFEIIKAPETAEDLNQEIEALNAGYHVATTRLYTSRKK